MPRTIAVWRVIRLCLLVTAVCAVSGTLMGLAGRHWWVFDLFSHFRTQYTVLLTVTAVYFLMRSSYRYFLLFAIFAAVNLYVIAPVSLKASTADIEGRSFRALLLNVSHGNFKYNTLRGFIGSANADFVILVEVNDKLVEALKPLQANYPYSQIHSDTQNGIMLLSRYRYEDARIEAIGNVGLPTVVARFDFDGRRMLLIGTHLHAPTNRAKALYRNQQLTALAEFISGQSETTILLGDLNLTPWSPYFGDFLSQAGLRDTRQSFGIQPTWPVPLPFMWIPIDHVLTSNEVVIRRREVGPNVGSDHYPVLVDFSITSRRSRNVS